MFSFKNTSNKFLIIILLVMCFVATTLIFDFGKLRSRFDRPNINTPSFVFAPSPSPSPTPTPPSVEIIFGGDMMFDRHIRQKVMAQGDGYDFVLRPLTTLLTSVDLVVANLEGPVTNFDSISINSKVGGPKNYTFTFDPVIVGTLKRYHIGLVNLGNNHMMNFGGQGLAQTLDYLSQGGVGWFGYTGNKPETLNSKFETLNSKSDTRNPKSETLNSKSEILNSELETRANYVEDVGWVAQRTTKDQTFLFVNFNQFTNQQLEPLLQYIRQRRPQVDWIIVMPHWDNEYQTTPAPITRQRAHWLIDAGADLIVGAHPHVVSEIETYHGKKIYYSLGNFVFDQYFEPAVRKGLLVKTSFKSGQRPQFEEIYTWLETNGQTKLGKFEILNSKF